MIDSLLRLFRLPNGRHVRRFLSDSLMSDGGPGSGNFGHKGRPGQRGGSGKGGSRSDISAERDLRLSAPVRSSAPIQSNFSSEKAVHQFLLKNIDNEDEKATAAHVDGPEYWKAAKKSIALGKPPKSRFTVNMKSLRAKVKNKIRSGDYTVKESSRGDFRVYMEFDNVIGTVYNKYDPSIHTDTKYVCLSVSRASGKYHMYPISEELYVSG